MKKRYLIIAIVSALLLASCTSTPTGKLTEQNTQKAPDFETTTTNGHTFTLSDSIAEGKPTVLYFMASWCPKCAQNWKGINTAYPKYEDNINFLAISIDPTDDAATLKQLAEDKGFVFDTVPGNPEIARLFNVKKQTAKFAIDSDGTIIKRHDGVYSAEEWDKLFASLA